jgi:hypothetical protein
MLCEMWVSILSYEMRVFILPYEMRMYTLVWAQHGPFNSSVNCACSKCKECKEKCEFMYRSVAVCLHYFNHDVYMYLRDL